MPKASALRLARKLERTLVVVCLSVSCSGLQFLAQPLRKTRVINSPFPPGSCASFPSLQQRAQPMLFRARLSQPRYIPFAILQRSENFPPQLQLMKDRSQLAPGCSGDGWGWVSGLPQPSPGPTSHLRGDGLRGLQLCIHADKQDCISPFFPSLSSNTCWKRKL